MKRINIITNKMVNLPSDARAVSVFLLREDVLKEVLDIKANTEVVYLNEVEGQTEHIYIFTNGLSIYSYTRLIIEPLD